jgi:hypothetical protein
MLTQRIQNFLRRGRLQPEADHAWSAITSVEVSTRPSSGTDAWHNMTDEIIGYLSQSAGLLARELLVHHRVEDLNLWKCQA